MVMLQPLSPSIEPPGWRSFPAIFRCLAWALCCLLLGPALADPPEKLGDLPNGPLGHWLQILVEEEAPLSLEQARQAVAHGKFQLTGERVPKFGIGAKPVWLYLEVENDGRRAVDRRLQLEISWLDRIDVYQIHGKELISHWAAGDRDISLQHPSPGLGYVFDLILPPGNNELLVRISTSDPLLAPLRLLDNRSAEALQKKYNYGYGLLYGFLFALIAYNAMLYIGLRNRGYLDYSLYLSSFVLTNVAYTGHGYGWLWPQFPTFQQYVIPVLMLLFGCLGLRFASGFLSLRRHAPRTHRMTHGLIAIATLSMTVAVASGQQQYAVLIAFVFLLTVSVSMVWIGLITVLHGRDAGGYFLAAALAAMAGTATTALAVWIGLPFSALTFHAAGWGIVIEGILFALALAHRMRKVQLARQQAEHLANIDPLTGLLNRRSFFTRANPIWSTALRNQRPLSVMMVDIDFFKRINDKHGHAVGDQVLQAVSERLTAACRSGDVAARWGGEEFVIVLPETLASQASQLAERLRADIEAMRINSNGQTFSLSASFGIAGYDGHDDLEQLIRESDHWLYQAKQGGRNRVAGNASALPQGSG